MLPSPKRIGKEAYYNRNTIFSYIRCIEILNIKFGLLLSEVREILHRTECIEKILFGPDDNGDDIIVHSIVALGELLEELLEYEENEASQCGSSMDGPDFSPEQIKRLDRLRQEIARGLRGSKKDIEKLISGGILNLEMEIFPKGKTPPVTNRDDFSGGESLDEVPF